MYLAPRHLQPPWWHRPLGAYHECPGGGGGGGWGRFKNTYELVTLRAYKFSPVDKIHIFQCMGMIFCVEFQRVPLKFHTKYLIFIHWNIIFLLWNLENLRALRVKSSYAFLKRPPDIREPYTRFTQIYEHFQVLKTYCMFSIFFFFFFFLRYPIPYS